MKNITIVSAIIVVIFAFASCNKNESKMALSIDSIASASTHVSPRSYINSNAFLSVDTRDKVISAMQDTDVAKLKAAVYRFYKHVSVQDSKYVTSLKGANEINLSNDLYNLLKENMDQMNKDIDKLREKGKKVMIQEVTPEYLNSLID